jgi:hypothetical protein
MLVVAGEAFSQGLLPSAAVEVVQEVQNGCVFPILFRITANLAGQRGALSMSLRPVSIKQLIEAHQPHAEAPWQIEGKDVGHVRPSLLSCCWQLRLRDLGHACRAGGTGQVTSYQHGLLD